jgi:hypothetical protein
MNKVKNEIKDTMIIYKKENPSFQTLGNTYLNPSTRRLEYKEHMTIKTDSSTSLTSSEKIMYHQEIDGIVTKK